MATAARTITANYTLANDDYAVFCNNVANVAVVTITPPAAAASNKGRIYVIKRVNAEVNGNNDNCQVANVDGIGTPKVLTGPGGTSASSPSGIIIQSDGTGWWIIGIAP